MNVWLVVLVVLLMGGCAVGDRPTPRRGEGVDRGQMQPTKPIKWGDVDRLPGESVGPIRPHRNFYQYSRQQPAYVLARYTVEGARVTESEARRYLRRSLAQIRKATPDMFPEPARHFVVFIFNANIHKNPSSFQRAHEFGAVFDSAQVFDPAVDLGALADEASLDRQPFAYDETSDTRHWPIIERHQQGQE